MCLGGQIQYNCRLSVLNIIYFYGGISHKVQKSNFCNTFLYIYYMPRRRDFYNIFIFLVLRLYFLIFQHCHLLSLHHNLSLLTFSCQLLENRNYQLSKYFINGLKLYKLQSFVKIHIIANRQQQWKRQTQNDND